MPESEPTPQVDRILAPRSRFTLGVGASVVLLLLGLGVAVLVSAFGAAGASSTISAEATVASDPPATPHDGAPIDPQATGPPGAAIFVHLLGAVVRPGLYELRDGDRVVDAVAAAGGLGDTADQSGVNLARLLVDGEQIYLPAVGEVPPQADAGGPAIGGSSAGGPAPSAGKVNLNTADQSTLDTLPGVGPATAADILAWREKNGRFTAIEDLLSVDGIGDKTFDRLKDLVVV